MSKVEKKESIIDSFFNEPQVTEFCEKSKKISQNDSSRTCHNGGPGET